MSECPNSLREFEASFADDGSFARWLSAKRWSDGFRCPACYHGKGFERERGVSACRLSQADIGDGWHGPSWQSSTVEGLVSGGMVGGHS